MELTAAALSLNTIFAGYDEALLGLMGNLDQIDPCPAAGGTGNETDTLPVESQCFEDIPGGIDLIHGIVGQ